MDLDEDEFDEETKMQFAAISALLSGSLVAINGNLMLIDANGNEVSLTLLQKRQLWIYTKDKLIPIKDNRWILSVLTKTEIVQTELGVKIICDENLEISSVEDGVWKVTYLPRNDDEEPDNNESDANKWTSWQKMNAMDSSYDSEYYDDEDEEDYIMRRLDDGYRDPLGF
ncbi:MAG: hypothetical protein ACRYFV_16600 [Janthinobacterium lividum]